MPPIWQSLAYSNFLFVLSEEIFFFFHCRLLRSSILAPVWSAFNERIPGANDSRSWRVCIISTKEILLRSRFLSLFLLPFLINFYPSGLMSNWLHRLYTSTWQKLTCYDNSLQRGQQHLHPLERDIRSFFFILYPFNLTCHEKTMVMPTIGTERMKHTNLNAVYIYISLPL